MFFSQLYHESRECECELSRSTGCCFKLTVEDLYKTAGDLHCASSGPSEPRRSRDHGLVGRRRKVSVGERVV